jgi:hypothetical protein
MRMPSLRIGKRGLNEAVRDQLTQITVPSHMPLRVDDTSATEDRTLAGALAALGPDEIQITLQESE